MSGIDSLFFIIIITNESLTFLCDTAVLRRRILRRHLKPHRSLSSSIFLPRTSSAMEKGSHLFLVIFSLLILFFRESTYFLNSSGQHASPVATPPSPPIAPFSSLSRMSPAIQVERFSFHCNYSCLMIFFVLIFIKRESLSST